LHFVQVGPERVYELKDECGEDFNEEYFKAINGKVLSKIEEEMSLQGTLKCTSLQGETRMKWLHSKLAFIACPGEDPNWKIFFQLSEDAMDVQIVDCFISSIVERLPFEPMPHLDQIVLAL